jgi:putative PIN family toxin of toxin-antitoxin system
MKVVFDTNIFVAALVFPGGRAEAAMHRILDGSDELLISPAILDEVLRVLAEKFARDKEELSRVAVLLGDMAEVVRPRRSIHVLADEPDNRILECAVAGGADRVVTGDKGMLALGSFQDIPIVPLKSYLEIDA